MKSGYRIFILAVPICFIIVFCLSISLFTSHSSGNEPAVENTSQENEVPESAAKASEVQAPPQAVKPRVAYLTFDDGPCKLTPELLDALRGCNVHATFFVVGLNSQEYPDSLKQMVCDGDVIGVHSWTHKYSYIYKSTENFLNDFNKLDDYIKQTTGVSPNICRFPGGTNNTVSLSYNKNHIMKSIVALVEEKGFKYFDWNVSSDENNTTPPTKDQIVNTVVSQCSGKNTAVILFHDTDHQGFIDAIPEIVSKLSSMGFTFDTLSPDDPPAQKAAAVQFRPS